MANKTVTPVHEIIDELGATIVESSSHWSTPFIYYGNKFYIAHKGNRYSISLSTSYDPGNHYESDKYLNTIVTSLTVADHRSAKDIAAEINRKIDWEGIATWLKMRADETAKHNEFINNTVNTAQKIVEITNGRIKSNSENTQQIIDIPGPWYSRNLGNVIVSGEHISIDFGGITNKQMVFEIMEIVAKHSKK